MEGKLKRIIIGVIGAVVITAVGIGVALVAKNLKKETLNNNIENVAGSNQAGDFINEDKKYVAIKKSGNVLSSTEKFSSDGLPYTEANFSALVGDYNVNPDLSNVENLNWFSNLNQEQINLLSKNGFVVSPTFNSQFHYVYEDNTYNQIPSFITTDSVLHVYHIFYDYTLRDVENASLYDAAAQLNTNMLDELINEYMNASDSGIKQHILATIGYFGVAQLAYGYDLPEGFPNEIKDVVNKEFQLIEKADGFDDSPLLGKKLDYSLFTPRGHYTRSEKLKKYFKGTTWYGNAFFEIISAENKVNNDAAVRVIIIANALDKLETDCGINLWNGIYSTTSFFAGDSDDITPKKIIEISKNIYGSNINLSMLLKEDKLAEFINEIKKLPKPVIDAEGTQGVQFRFMGQRYVPDSEILQKLVKSEEKNPDTGEIKGRAFPNGLDVMSVLGSNRAKDLNVQYYNPAARWTEYNKIFAELRAKFSKVSQKTWESNMYYAWLNTLRSLNKEFGQGYPMFMRNNSWNDKSLATSLSGWTEIRHDTILYAKQSNTAECGGGDDDEGQEVPVIRGYVEPNVEFYNKLLWLTKYSSTNLKDRNLLSDEIGYKMESLEKMLQFLKDCSIKELKNEELSKEEYDQLLTYGGWLENIILSFGKDGYSSDGVWYEITSTTDENMALIADVHTVRNQYLEEAIGNAAEIYVIVPINGKLYLTRGSVFDYFEFISDKRLTDEEWQKVVGGTSYRPEWTENFMTGVGSQIIVPEGFSIKSYSSGC